MRRKSHRAASIGRTNANWYAPGTYFSPAIAYVLLGAVGFMTVKHLAIALDRKHECHAMLALFGWVWIA